MHASALHTSFPVRSCLQWPGMSRQDDQFATRTPHVLFAESSPSSRSVNHSSPREVRRWWTDSCALSGDWRGYDIGTWPRMTLASNERRRPQGYCQGELCDEGTAEAV